MLKREQQITFGNKETYFYIRLRKIVTEFIPDKGGF